MTVNSDNRLELSRALSRLDRLGPQDPLPRISGGRGVGAAYRVGITGPVGAGKSTLIARLAGEIRRAGLTLGVIAIDPSSPFTGGAVLGDRVRMTDLAADEGVFIRSMATRGAFGGLAAAAVDAADIMDDFGFDRIIIETVGVGQTEVDVAGACDLTLVVLEPASGDDVQAIKAGLMEIADIFVVNKADLKGAQRFILDLQSAVELRAGNGKAPVVPVQAVDGEGVAELWALVEQLLAIARGDGSLKARRAGQRARRIRWLADEAAVRRLHSIVPQERVEELARSELPVREAARRVLEGAFGGME